MTIHTGHINTIPVLYIRVCPLSQERKTLVRTIGFSAFQIPSEALQKLFATCLRMDMPNCFFSTNLAEPFRESIPDDYLKANISFYSMQNLLLPVCTISG